MIITKHYFGAGRPLKNYNKIQIVLEPKQQLSAIAVERKALIVFREKREKMKTKDIF